MSQNKTIVPGVDYDNHNDSQDDFAYGGLYSRSGDESQRTYVPGVRQQPASVLPNNSVVSNSPILHNQRENNRQIVMQERVVVGVMFSISRGLLGEMFPVYLGKNIIGQTPICDIPLKEKTVSPEHAILHTRKTETGLEASITDFNSTFGTQVNETDARYETIPIKENDIITIGSHYQFVIKFFEMEKCGLAENSDFEDPSADNFVGEYNNVASADVDFYRPTREEGDSSRTVIY